MLALPQRKQWWCGERKTVERPEVLQREIKALVFDQYGTIVDMQDTVLSTVVRGYDLRKPGGYLGNVGSMVVLIFAPFYLLI
jgi:hypothetical protein